MVKPTFLGIGAQKCASSWIRNVLHDHPEVFVSHPREVDFFSYHYNRGYTWYERHFDHAGTAKAIGEISPSYFCDPLAPAWVREYKRDVKLILTLRDPIARAFSNHLHEIRMGHFRGADLRFEAGLESNPMYLFQSRYGTHLANWLREFPKDRVLRPRAGGDPGQRGRSGASALFFLGCRPRLPVKVPVSTKPRKRRRA